METYKIKIYYGKKNQEQKIETIENLGFRKSFGSYIKDFGNIRVFLGIKDIGLDVIYYNMETHEEIYLKDIEDKEILDMLNKLENIGIIEKFTE